MNPEYPSLSSQDRYLAVCFDANRLIASIRWVGNSRLSTSLMRSALLTGARPHPTSKRPLCRLTGLPMVFIGLTGLAGTVGLEAATQHETPEARTTSPSALRPDIRIEHVATVAPKSIRLARDPVSENLHYTTLDGEVFELHMDGDGEPTSVLVADVKDHGIVRLQGMVFVGPTLYLAGNVPVNDGKGTKGRVMAGTLNQEGTRVWSTVFSTDEIGSTKTTFDHGFNGLTASPDGRYLFINSGARTDHGEIQDNDGAYPGARDEPLTAAVLRIPAGERDLLLRNDLDELTENGYLFARGIRNGFDLAHAPNGHLFIVSNSGDYDHPEDMFWLREGHHYGYPWIMGGIENPQQYPDFKPDPEKDPFLNPYSHAYSVGYFGNDPAFPKRPPDLVITPAVANIGPDANTFRDPISGTIRDGDEAGVAVGTFTAHRSPLGLVFDVDSLLGADLTGDGFMLSWTNGAQSTLMGRLSRRGSDLMHLKLFHSPAFDNYIVQATRIAEGFNGPTDVELVDHILYVIEYGGSSANLWKLMLPAADNSPDGSAKRATGDL